MLSKFFINRPKFAFVISILIVIVGLAAIYSLPIAEYPQIIPPTVSVVANYPGASATTIAETVTTPLEEKINGVENMMYFSSKSTDQGTSTITVTFELGTDPQMNTVNVNNRVEQAMASLPYEVVKEGVTVTQKSSEILMIIALYSDRDIRDDLYLSNFTSINLLNPIERISGVAQAKMLGAEDYSMRIWLDPNKMASLKVSPQEVINAVERQNIQVAAGSIGSPQIKDGQAFHYKLETQGRLKTPEEFENIIVRSTNNGAFIRVKDIAKVNLGSYSYASYSQLNNKPAALLAIYQLAGANAINLEKNIKEKIEDLSAGFPSDIKTKVLFNTARYVKASIKQVVYTLITAFVLVVLVIFIFLQDWRSTLIPTIAIPVSLIGTFAALLALGYSINIITMLGMILAIGIVVDDAIVVTENVHRLMDTENADIKTAVINSMEQVSGPIIATTSVLLATFVPVAFIPGLSGELYRQFAVTVIVAVCLSAFNALTLSPALCTTLLKHKRKKPFILFRYFNKAFDFISRQYNTTISFLIRRLAIIIGMFILLLISVFLLYKNIPQGFVPEEDQGGFIVNVQLPSGSSLHRTGKIMRKVTDLIKRTDGVTNVLSAAGFDRITDVVSSNCGFIAVILEDWSKRKTPELQIDYIINELNKKFETIPGAEITAFNIPAIKGLGVGGGFEYELQQKEGSDFNQLNSVLKKIIKEGESSPVIKDIYSTFRNNVPKLFLDINKEKVEKLSVPMENLHILLQAYLGSMYVNQFNRFGQVYKVLLELEPKFRERIENIYQLNVLNKYGEIVKLKNMLRVKPILGTSIVNHYNMLNSAEIHGSAAEGYSSGEAIAEMEKISKKIIPGDMTYSWTSTSYQEILAGNLVVIIFAMAIVIIYLFLVAQYESWLIAVSVLLSVPIAVLGALIAIKIAGIDNNIYVQIGIVLLFGMSTKTAILIVEFAKKQHENGKSILEAAEIASKLRFRAIVMTAIAFILGVFPLVIATGAGSNSRKSLGTSVFGGLILAVILGTIFVPTFYVFFQKIIDRKLFKKK